MNLRLVLFVCRYFISVHLLLLQTDAVLSGFQGQEDTIYASLVKNFGPEPEETHTPAHIQHTARTSSLQSSPALPLIETAGSPSLHSLDTVFLSFLYFLRRLPLILMMV